MKGEPCTFEGCDKPRVARGLCMGHYMQQRRGKELRPLYGPSGKGRRMRRPCSFEGCGRLHNGKGLCAAHRAQKAQGRPLVPIGAAKRWWWPTELAEGGMPTESLKRGA